MNKEKWNVLAFLIAAVLFLSLVIPGRTWHAMAATLINLTNQVTGTLPHGNGGTDVTSPGTSGNVLTSNGTSWVSQANAGGGSVTVNGQTCTIGSTCTVSGAEVTKIASYVLTAAELGKLVVFNCSSACTATLYGTPTNGFYGAIMSIGSSVATVSLNSLNFNGSSGVPVLISNIPLEFWSDGTNYFGTAPLIAGTGLSFTPTSNGLTIALVTPVSATNGGTGVSNPTAHSIMVAEGASAMNPINGSGCVYQSSSSADPTFVACGGSSGGGFAYGGDASDGNVVATTGGSGLACIGTQSSSKYTLTRDCFFGTFEVQNGVTIETSNWRIFAQTSITVDSGGIIDNSGINNTGTSQGGSNGCGNNTTNGAYSLPMPFTNTGCTGTGGASGVAGGTGAGTQGNAGSAGHAGSNSICTSQFSPSTWSSGAGGNGSGGSGGISKSNGAAGSFTLTKQMPRYAPFAIAVWDPSGATLGTTYSICNESGSAASGGSGGGDGGAGGGSGNGGGNGGPGGFIVLVSPTITNNGTIKSNGGNAANGAAGANAGGTNRGGGGGGAGGAGGNGGCIFLIYHSLVAGTITVTAGTHGTGGGGGTHTGSGTDGNPGQNGPDGNTGIIIEIPI